MAERMDTRVVAEAGSISTFPLPVLRTTRAHVFEFFDSIGLSRSEAGYLQDVTFHVDGTVSAEFLGRTIDDIMIDKEVQDVWRSVHRYRLLD